MDTVSMLEQAKQIFDVCVFALEKRKWKYDKNENNLTIETGITGDDFPICFSLKIIPELMIIQLNSKLPFIVPDEKITDIAVAVCFANTFLCDGNFDYEMSEGTISFRMTSSYRESIISPELICYMMDWTAVQVDIYDEKLYGISEGLIDFKQFAELIING